ncbi:MAG TPA: EmrB/QacA family drug resistance transporter [Pseudomonas sp.]|nr:EmrB/QacA family drug resistance transporter [Pseudomonas sp.]
MPGEDSVSLRSWVAVIGGVVGCFMAGMNVHVTNASLPDVRGSLGATFEEGSWITTAYLVAEIIVIPLAAWLAAVFTVRRVLMVGAAGFVIFSMACSIAPNINAMILARTLQGAFGGVLIPLSFQLIVTELPSSKHPFGMALFAIANNVAQAAGPSLGGWLTDAYSWRWIFYLQLFPGIALLCAIAWSIEARPMKLQLLRHGDWLGIAAMVIGLGGLQIVLEEGGRLDWFGSSFITGMTVVSALALVLFVTTQLFGPRAFINLRLLGRYNFGVASLAMFIFGAATFGLVFLVPNYLSQLQGFSARDVGVALIAYGLVQLLLAPLMPRLMRWTSAKFMVASGFLIMALGCWMGASLTADSADNVIIPSTVVRGIGQPFIMVALSVLAVAGLDKREAGSASAVFSMLRNLGGAIGTAGLTQLVATRERLHSARIHEHVTVFEPQLHTRLDPTVQTWLWHSQQWLEGLSGTIRREAYLMAYSDAFYLACLALLGCAVAALLLRSHKG